MTKAKVKSKPVEEENVIITSRSDIFMAALWSNPKNEHLLLSFINGVLLDAGMTPITKATVMSPHNIKQFAVEKSIALDVRVEDENKRIFHIEIQIKCHFGFVNRILHYWADTYSSQLYMGEQYNQLKPVISIIITDFDEFPLLKNFHTVFRAVADENPKVWLSDHFQIHLLRLAGVLKGHWENLVNVHENLQNWAKFWVYAADKTEEEMSVLVKNNPMILEAQRELKIFSSDKENRELVRSRRKFINETVIMLNAAIEEGETKGKVEGKVEGKIEEKQETVQRLRSKGYDTNAIADATGLSEEEIMKLR